MAWPNTYEIKYKQTERDGTSEESGAAHQMDGKC